MHRDVGRTRHQPSHPRRSKREQERSNRTLMLTEGPLLPQAGGQLFRDGSEVVVVKLHAKGIGRFNIEEIALGPIPCGSIGVGRIAFSMIRIVMIEHRIPSDGREVSGRRVHWAPKGIVRVVGSEERCWAAGPDEHGCVACCG